MRRVLSVSAFAFYLALLAPRGLPQAATTLIAPAAFNQGPARAAQADAVVVGRVVAMEDKDVKVKDVTYRIAVVQVTETLKGAKEQMVKVGFVPVQNAANPANPQGGIGLRPVRFGSPQLTVGDDGLFMLTKGPDGKFFTVTQFGSFVKSDAANYKTEVETAKVAIKVGGNTTAALKSNDPQERLMGVTILLDKYRAPMLKPKQEPIDAAESKLILKALASSDWTAQPFNPTHPYMLFNRLGVTAKDGWTPPRNVRNVQEITKAAKEWVEKNAETYRIQKNVGGQPIGTPNIRPLPPIQIQPGGNRQVQPGVLPVVPPANKAPQQAPIN